jgi:hypothetical protein
MGVPGPFGLVRPCGLTSRSSSARVRVVAMLSGRVAPSVAPELLVWVSPRRVAAAGAAQTATATAKAPAPLAVLMRCTGSGPPIFVVGLSMVTIGPR